jgi:hypothetical protein
MLGIPCTPSSLVPHRLVEYESSIKDKIKEKISNRALQSYWVRISNCQLLSALLRIERPLMQVLITGKLRHDTEGHALTWFMLYRHRGTKTHRSTQFTDKKVLTYGGLID